MVVPYRRETAEALGDQPNDLCGGRCERFRLQGVGVVNGRAEAVAGPQGVPLPRRRLRLLLGLMKLAFCIEVKSWCLRFLNMF